MPRFRIQHSTISYAGREVVSPGAALHLEDVSLELPWSYGVSTVSTVNGRRASIVDAGNASGELSLPVVQDFPDITSALAALIELKAWADAHPTGPLSLALTHPPEPLPTELAWELSSPSGRVLGGNWVHFASPPVMQEPVVRVEFETPRAEFMKICYLSFWQQREDGEWEHLAISDAKGEETQLPGALYSVAFTFTPGFVLSGRPIRFHFNTERNAEWAKTPVVFFVTPCADGSFIDDSEYPAIPIFSLYRAAGPPIALTYSAGLQALNTRLTLAPRGYRLTAEWQWLLT